nr:hypothetical protein L203_06001 [Cryptococcus depauperatus CBS 7841]
MLKRNIYWQCIARGRGLAGARQVRAQSFAPSRPSPYRLLQPSAFKVSFAPLLAQGWTLEYIDSGRLQDESEPACEGNMGTEDLQGRHLVRIFNLGHGKEGWKRMMAFTSEVGQVVEEQDHHPTMHISSLANSSNYTLTLSTHTHTPLPPYPLPKGSCIQPGVTTKDVQLAERIEQVYRKFT